MVSAANSDAESRMKMALAVFTGGINSIRTGRATPAILDNITIDYYGVPTPLNQLATISTPDARLLTVQPWDRQAISEIEKAILKSDLGLNPSNDGTLIRLPLPQLTEERRREIVKTLKNQTEQARVAVRNVRRDAIEKIRGMERSKDISQDESRRSQEQMQKTTDTTIAQINHVSEAKETEIMEV